MPLFTSMTVPHKLRVERAAHKASRAPRAAIYVTAEEEGASRVNLREEKSRNNQRDLSTKMPHRLGRSDGVSTVTFFCACVRATCIHKMPSGWLWGWLVRGGGGGGVCALFPGPPAVRAQMSLDETGQGVRGGGGVWPFENDPPNALMMIWKLECIPWTSF